MKEEIFIDAWGMDVDAGRAQRKEPNARLVTCACSRPLVALLMPRSRYFA
jgi:hypothetical protein